MKQRHYLLLAIAVVTLLSSCAPKVPFTQTIRNEHRLSNEEMQQLQFYVSRDIVLQRGETKDTEKATDQGELTITDGKYVEEVRIPANTPGVVEKVIDNSKIAVSFEDGGYLVFGNPNGRGKYTLLAAEWKNGRGMLKYKDKMYVATSGSENAYLIFTMKRLRKFKKDARVVGGKKL